MIIMEDLFSTRLSVQHQSVPYHVVFDQDQYTFLAPGGDGRFPRFSFTRTQDTWLGQEGIPPDLQKQAIDALEAYLLRQH